MDSHCQPVIKVSILNQGLFAWFISYCDSNFNLTYTIKLSAFYSIGQNVLTN